VELLSEPGTNYEGKRAKLWVDPFTALCLIELNGDKNVQTKKILVFGVSALLVVAAVISLAVARLGRTNERYPPPTVSPVLINGVEFRVPNLEEGVVEAWEIKSQEMLWTKKVYSTLKIPFQEKDTQWVFISKLTQNSKTNELLIENERGRKYILDVVTKKVRAAESQ
jgi:hypothetical protein